MTIFVYDSIIQFQKKRMKMYGSHQEHIIMLIININLGGVYIYISFFPSLQTYLSIDTLNIHTKEYEKKKRCEMTVRGGIYGLSSLYYVQFLWSYNVESFFE